MAKDTLIIMCSGIGFIQKVLEFIHQDLKLADTDYDLLAVPGGAHSLGITAFLPKFRWALEHWIKFLVQEHQIKRVIIIDHKNCAWFDKLAISDPEFIGRAQSHWSGNLSDYFAFFSVYRPDMNIEAWQAENVGDLVQFKKVN